MQRIEHIYINGEFVIPHGLEWFDLHNPSTEEVIGQVRLGDALDAQRAIAAAKVAFPAWARTSREERIAALQRMHRAMAAREEELLEAILVEYGAPAVRGRWMATYPVDVIAQAIDALEAFDFEEQVGMARVILTPVGVTGLITPWNSNAGFICNKLATALATGCTAVIKPSEMSALQTQVVVRALHEAGLPPGVFNVVNGRGEVVGEEIARHPDVAKISFTGSSAVGQHLVRTGADTMKRVTLELGGKSPTVVLEDADFQAVMPLVLQAGFQQRPGLHRGHSYPRTAQPAGRVRADCEGGGITDSIGRSTQRRHRYRPDGEPETMGTGAALYPYRPGGGREAAGGWRRSSGRLARRMVREAHDLHGCQQPDAHRA